jgi:hypothetical protein
MVQFKPFRYDTVIQVRGFSIVIVFPLALMRVKVVLLAILWLGLFTYVIAVFVAALFIVVVVVRPVNSLSRVPAKADLEWCLLFFWMLGRGNRFVCDVLLEDVVFPEANSQHTSRRLEEACFA